MVSARKRLADRIASTRTRRLRWSLVAMVFLSGLISTISLTYVAARLGAAETWRRADTELEHGAMILRAAIARIESIEHVAAAFFAASQEVEPAEFAVFTRAFVDNNDDLLALLWVPRIEPSLRDEHQQQAAARGLRDYQVRGVDGEPVARERLAYPTWFSAQSSDSVPIAFGFDWSTIPPARLAMEAARDSGEVVASAPLSPWLEHDGFPLNVLAAPIYRKGLPVTTIEERQVAIHGFIMALERPRSLLQQIGPHLHKALGLSLYLVDMTTLNAPHFLASFDGRDGRPEQSELDAIASSKLNHIADVPMARRAWRLVGVPSHVGTGWTAGVLGWLLGGLLLSLLLTSLVWLGVGRISRSELDRLQAISDSRTKSEFLAKMSHELRTPLNAIVGLSDLLVDTPLSESQQADLAQISRSADTLLRLVSDILDLSRIEAGQLELAAEPMSLHSVVEDSLTPLIQRAQIKGLEMACRVAPDIPDALIGDAGRLQQILINLVGNAVKFTNRGEIQIEVTCTARHDDRVVLEFSVRDTGPGISLEQQETIFQLFVQGDDGSRHAEGVGLGLATANQLVQMMGGHLWVESELDWGSIFRFTVDLELDKNRSAAAELKTPLSGTRLLIVDHNPLSRQSLTEIAASWGMSPYAVGDSATCLATLRTAADEGTPFPLVLLDLDLEDRGAPEVATAIRADASIRSAVIFMTSKGDGKAASEAKAAGFVVRLEKPISRSKLLEAIERALGIQPLMTRSKKAPSRRTRLPMKILLAEDNRLNQAITQRMLASLGHEVACVDNGLEAVDAVGREHFDAVLMDYDMPVMDGIEAVRTIRARDTQPGSHVPIIALTAYAMQEDRNQLLQAGTNDVLTKPVRLNELDDALEAIRGSTGTEHSASPPPKAEIAVSSPEQAATIDFESLVQLGDSHEVIELIEMLETQIPQLESQIKAAINNHDADPLRFAAHSLKGSLLLFGAEQASAAAQRLEELGRRKTLNGAEDALSELQARLAELRVALEPIKQHLILYGRGSETATSPAMPQP